MTGKQHETGKSGEQDRKSIPCRRTGQLYDSSNCKRCPYCYGDDADVEGTDVKTFCDFHPGVDPVHFGFPGDDARTQRG